VSRIATDFLRVIAITFIVMNHTGWPFYMRSATDRAMTYDRIVAFLNQLGKPSVLIFIFLSGLAFANHRITKNFSAGRFYLHRFMRIFPPYLLVSFLGFYFYDTVAPSEFIFSLVDGSAMYHLYFVALIGYCYLLFPVMRTISFNLANALLLVSIFIVGNLLIASLYPSSIHPFLADRIAALHFPSIGTKAARWSEYLLFALFFFQSGIWIGKRKSPNTETARSRLAALFFILLFVGFALEWIDFSTRVAAGIDADDSGRVWRWSVAFYGFAWIGFLVFIRPVESHPALRKLARTSFLVYLFHPFLLNATKHLGETAPLFHYLFMIAASWALALVLYRLGRANKFAGFILGEGDHLFEKVLRKG